MWFVIDPDGDKRLNGALATRLQNQPLNYHPECVQIDHTRCVFMAQLYNRLASPCTSRKTAMTQITREATLGYCRAVTNANKQWPANDWN